MTHFEAFVASSKDKLYFAIYDLKNQKFVDKCYYYDKLIKKTLQGPIFKFQTKNKYSKTPFFVDNNVVFLSNYGGWNAYPEKKALIFTDKPIYKPGDLIHFRINLFKRKNDRYIPYSSTSKIVLKDPFNNVIFSKDFSTDELGGFSFDYKTTEEIITGNYTIIVYENDSPLGIYYLLIQDYTKPTYTISLTANATQIIAGNTLNVKLKATYLNGDPVKNAEILFYTFNYSTLINKYKAVTDDKGEAVYNIYLKEKGFYRIQALVVDDSGKQYDKNIYIDVKADNVNIDGELKDGILTLYITDLSGHPLKGVGIITLNDKDIFFEVLDGKANIEIPENIWKVVVKFGKESKTIYESFVRSKNEIISSNKNEINIGESLNIKIDPKQDVGILVIGGSEIQDIKLIDNVKEFTIKIPDDEISSTYFIEFLGNKLYDRMAIKINHDRVKKLNIKINKKQYKPGEIVEVQFPNSNSLKIVSIVDEGLYTLSESKSVIESLYPTIYYPPFEIYKSSKYVYFNFLSQFETTKESHIFASTKEAEKRRIREYFPETAYWNPNLYENEFSFKSPDSITKWRVTAYEISKDYIAEGTATFVVTKPFEVKLFIPEFLTTGDKVTGLLYVKNYTETSGKVTVSLKTNNGTLNFQNGTFEIENDLKIPFILKDFKEGTLEITAEASMTDNYDGLKLSIPVYPIYIEKNVSKIVKITGEKSFKEDENIRIINSLKDLLEPSIKALIRYPYGCTEQTMSSFYPALIAKSFIEYPDLDDIILKGLQRLLKFQHRDGGWGWWINDESDVFMTSYVLEGLYYAKKLGYYYPDVAVNDAIEYLKKQKLTGYSVFVLSLYGVKIDFESKDILDIVYTSPEKIKEIATESIDKAYIKGKGFYSSIHLTSAAIRTLTRHNKYLDLRDKMVNYLLNSKKGPFWYSTKDSAFSVLAILESKNFKSNLSVEKMGNMTLVKGNGYVEVEATEKLYHQNISNGIEIKSELYKRYEVPFEDKFVDVFLPLNTRYIPVDISLSTTPTIYSEIPVEISEIITEGTPILFKENKLIVQGPFKFAGNDYSFKSGYYTITLKSNDDFSIHKGDFLKTTITIDGTGEFLVVEEYLPACAQVIENYSEKQPDYYSKFSYSWYKYDNIWYSYRELKKEKVAFFIRYLTPGVLTYYWRVTHNGTFIKRPTYVYNMYYEDTFAFGNVDTFNIK